MFGFKSASEKPEKKSWLAKLSSGLRKTRQQLGSGIVNLLKGKKKLDAETLETLESILLRADVGVEATQAILDRLTQHLSRKELKETETVMEVLKEQLTALLSPYAKPLTVSAKPTIFLMVGINGAGKTTSIAKMAHYYQAQGKKVILAAGDTFRAAAIEQLQVWGERNKVTVIAQQKGADSASVIFDAVQAAQARHYDLLLADTAGRLHTQQNLMVELEKIKRVMKKQNDEAPHETLLVVDAGMGQNALVQAEQFHQAIGLTGIILTKLDGTAKGGIIFAIAEKLKRPIYFVGVGEGIEDLKPFDAKAFVEALFES